LLISMLRTCNSITPSKIQGGRRAKI